MLSTPGAQSAGETRITRSNITLSGSQIDDISEFKRGRTKFTQAQIDELEALFATHGPHPTREQRALVAEKIDVYVLCPPLNIDAVMSSVLSRLSFLIANVNPIDPLGLFRSFSKIGDNETRRTGVLP